MGFVAPLAALAGAGATIFAATQKPDIPEVKGPSDEEVRKKAVARKERIVRSRERHLARQATLGPIQLQAPTLGGI